ncbi:MAG: hypothetical protein RL299_200, partial [Pseudomonadota bacterium]
MVNEMMKRLIDLVMGRSRVLINEGERAIWLYQGQVQGILEPGEQVLKNRDGSAELERLKLSQLLFMSVYEQAVLDKLDEDVARHLTIVRTGENEIAIIERDGLLNTVLAPDTKLVVWTDAGPWKATVVDISDSARVDPKLLKRLQKAGKVQQVTVVEVDEGKMALVSIDGQLTDRLGAGVYGYWNAGRKIGVKLIDLTRQSLDV